MWLSILVALAALLLLAAVLYLRASLAQLDGEQWAPKLAASVTVARDARGVPLVSAGDRLDAAYAVGFVHAQERFFQMDLLRRTAAGELAELFGPRVLPLDRSHRLHRFRARAEQRLASLSLSERELLDRYTAGVNHGLSGLRAKPFEYALTRTSPRPWSNADSLLVVWAMFLDLQGNLGPRAQARGWLRAHSTAEQLSFLLPEVSEWDQPFDAGVPAPAQPIPARAPVWWGRPGDAPERLALANVVDAVGSNNFALAGARTATGAAIVSDDMHLGLQLPNTWYLLAMRIGPERIAGVTLPGAPPFIIAGSNGHVAWALTNSKGDYLDLVALAQDPTRPDEVRTTDGWERPVETVERIRVKGADDERLVVRETRLGPIQTIGGRPFALHWIAYDPAAINLNHMKLERATTLDEALTIANSDGIPAQNFVAGDEHGNIGWTIAGMLPQRDDRAGTSPLGDRGPTWHRLLPPERYPRRVNPLNGQLSTANNRQLIGDGAQHIGDGGFDLGARQHQLRQDLAALKGRIGIPAAYRVALDDRALFIARWRERALALLDPAALRGHPQRAEFRRLLELSWNGHASTDSVGYRLARAYMWSLHALLFGGADREMTAGDPKANMALASSRWPVVVARLLDAQPAGWLPAGYADWRALQLASVDQVIGDLTSGGQSLAAAAWGERNRASIEHPISASLPRFLRTWLAVPDDPLPGDANMPRVAGPRFGQSERMTLSPGHEEQALFDMPGGQSGHPLSPFFLAGHADWVNGMPSPLLPGKARYTLTLMPCLVCDAGGSAATTGERHAPST
ncbi:penicillin acylase family protein [Massilia forsythiae]|nr:penicillin acylase family protein [Massilia forsythiae]